ncbi:GGDEF domain-containing protein [Saccharothrix longispora]|uniref:GGDEF domain-containing protein n=1 Tax=Saccharothrix longispora TaxID=33920 RepID=UPI0028FDC246|nr:GGDEF domain-containing protein [Saccharothrix longispora]MBY8849162.1 GGDEF domain-containing protein [Saccharothrix sp. MB29]MDU0291247.1 GGDEF domain-containing protein [Saccharothrix longispora]
MGRTRPASSGERRWKLWSLPRRALVYVLSVELLAAVAVVATTAWPVPDGSWTTFAVLAGCGALHLHCSRWIERVRRDHSHLPHVDLCSIWIVAGALVLPPVLAVAHTALIYLHRWWVVGRWDTSRPPHRCVFTTSMMVLATLAASAVAGLTGLRDRLRAGEPGGVLDLVGLVGAGTAQWLVNTALVAAVILLTVRPRSVKDSIGSAGDNLLEAGQLALGGFVALAVAWSPLFALPMVVAAVALHRTVLIHQLELAARTDTKTGLLNAEAWHLQARLELQRTRRQPPGAAVGVFMIDVDHFKDINDTHGHQTGDVVLRRMAEALERAVRRGDSVGRVGGEEFAVLLPDVGPDEARAVAERMRAEVHRVLVDDGAGGTVGGLTVSIGVAVWPEVAEDTLEGLLAAADSALYEAKRLGRDQVRAAGERRPPHRPPAARAQRPVPGV